MKLIIQVPCYNEAETLAITLQALPREVAGFSKVEWLVIDDGCTDNTVEVARSHGVDHVISFSGNQGLARSFVAGLEASVRLGADVIVNTDADNQYSVADIPALVAPVLAGKAEIVVGARPIEVIESFSGVKKLLQKIGSGVVRLFSNTDIPDAPSGFRAISRDAALRLNVFSDYTYTLETIIQAGQKNMAITSVPVWRSVSTAASHSRKSPTSIWVSCPARVEARVDSVRAAEASLNAIACSPRPAVFCLENLHSASISGIAISPLNSLISPVIILASVVLPTPGLPRSLGWSLSRRSSTRHCLTRCSSTS